MTRRKTSDAVKILHKRYVGKDKAKQQALQAEREKSGIAEQIYNLRKQAGLSQKELADLVGTTQSVISRLENADYTGQTLSMLQRIAEPFSQQVEVRFVPRTSVAYA